MKLTILPFKHVSAMADIDSGEIFLNESSLTDVEFNIKHEFSHVISGDPDHGIKFRDIADSFNIETPKTDLFKNIRKRIGIPNNIAANIGNVSGVQNMLLDFHLLQSYRKFASKVLGTEGHFEVINEGNSTVEGDSLSSKDQLIRLYPTPKGAFPVVVLYIPVINHFRSAQARQLAYDMMVAECKMIVGMSRRKVSGMPTPDGGSIAYDGSELVSEGQEAKDKIIESAINLGEPIGPWLW